MNKNMSKPVNTFEKLSITESSSNFENLDKMTVQQLLSNINQEDSKVHLAVRKAIPQIEKLVSKIITRMKKGGRIFYLGAGTSGRLGVLDASEIPPTFGVPGTMVIGLIAGGEVALRRAVESAEDDLNKAWKELEIFNINTKDTVIGIAASGTTPYVIGGIKKARENGILTGCITCNPESLLVEATEIPIVVVVGPEFVTGSTRLKAGTAQKMVLNMITTTVMIKLGRVKGNKMVNMQLTNRKLIERGTRMIVEELNIQREAARILLMQHGSVKKALESYKENYQ
ncbi:MAG: N-acetylmuramic acid 6-phosphate etherase [Bacteroidia bacterium]|nr:N-acetylmuramic acid 6-phosphate etherase [Bacteroidia bacterium]